MQDVYTKHMLDYCKRNVGDDVYYLSQFLDDIEPCDKKKVAAGLIQLLTSVDSVYIQRIYDDLVDRGADHMGFCCDHEEWHDSWLRTNDLRATMRGYSL